MTTVSARINDDLKEQIDELELDTSEIVREALTEAVKKRRRERIRERGERIKGVLSDSGVTTEDIAESIREDRDADLEDR